MDGQKAFDTVWIRSLLRNMYFTGISNDLWILLNQLYSDVSTKVKFDNIASDSFQMLQGVGQGGILSAPVYKQFNNKLLDTSNQLTSQRQHVLMISAVSRTAQLIYRHAYILLKIS